MFSDSGLEWGLRKCAAVNIKRGKITQEQTQVSISHAKFIPLLQNSDHYKFLGKQENATHLEEIVTREASKEYLTSLCSYLVKPSNNTKENSFN